MKDLSERIAGLSTDKLGRLLSQLKARRGEGSDAIPRRSSDTKVPLSLSQQGLWLIAQLEPDSAAYNVPAAFRIRGPLDRQRFRHSIDAVIARHEALRTSFSVSGEEPIQVIATTCEGSYREFDLSGVEDSQTAALEVLAVHESRCKFDLTKGPLFSVALVRLAPDDHALLVTLHHIITDAWSMGVLWRDLGAIYNASVDGRSSVLQPLTVQYGDYAIWQRRCLDGQRLRRQLAHWRRVLDQAPMLNLPSDRPRPAVQSFRGGSLPVRFSGRLLSAIKQLARHEETSVFVILLGAVMTLLHRATGQEHILMGTAVANRGKLELEPLIGFFVNLLPLLGDLSGSPSFTRLIRRLRQTVLDALSHQDVPFEKIVEELRPERSAAYHPMIQAVAVLYESPQLTTLQLNGLDVRPLEQQVQFSRMDLEFLFWESRIPSGVSEQNGVGVEQQVVLEGVWNYNLDLFDHNTIAGLFAQCTTLLESATTAPDSSIGCLRLMDLVEQQQTGRSSVREDISAALPWQPLHVSIAKRLEHDGDCPAIIEPSRSITGRELRARTLALAGRLRVHGAEPYHRIAVCLDPTAVRVTAILAVLEIGATVVPLDSDSPINWINDRLRDSGARLLITQREVFSRLSDGGADVVWIDPAVQEPVVEVAPPLTPYCPREDEVAILSYGVSTTAHSFSHHQLAQRVATIQLQHPLTTDDRILHCASLLRESALLEVLWPLTVGARVAVMPAVTDWEPWLTFARQQITVAHLTAPELYALFASRQRFCGPAANSDLVLRLVLCSGAPLPMELVREFCSKFEAELSFLHVAPALALELGAQRLTPELAFHRKSILSPWHDLRLVDTAGQPVPCGVRGEVQVVIGGEARTTLSSPSRWLPTGEIGVRRTDDNIELVEHSGRQVWLDDVFVEIDEVEEVIRDIANTSDCVVMVRNSLRGGGQVIAYLVAHSQLPSTEIASALKARLPAFVRPKSLVPVLRIPRTSGGQVDYDLLSQLPVLESALIPTWESVLRRDLCADEVAVTIQPEGNSDEVLHIDDLLPEWNARPVRSSGVQQSHETRRTTPTLSGSSPARAVGDTLRLEDDAPLTLPAALRRTVQRYPLQGILCLHTDDSEEFISYSSLALRAERVAAGLRRMGVCVGDRILLQLAKVSELIEGVWGCLLAGATVAPLAVSVDYDGEHSGFSKLHGAWELLGRPFVLSNAESSRRLQGLHTHSEFVDLRVLDIAALRQELPTDVPVERQPEDAALILLTSGSTGRPKGVVLSHQNICMRSLATIQVDGFSCHDVTLNWMPLDHVVGLVMYHLRDLLLGARQVHGPTAPVLADPLRWLAWIERFGVTVTWAPNFAYALVNERAEELSHRQFHLGTVRRIENGAESIVMRTARRFLELLEPHGLGSQTMFTGWGMTETSSGVTFSHRFSRATTSDEDLFVDLGAPLPGVEIQIVDDNDHIVTEGITGHLQVRGCTVTSGYWGAAELNQTMFTSDGWFRTGDLGHIVEGSLTLTGREKEVIIINAVNYQCHEIEAAVETVPGVESTYTAAVAVRPDGSQTDMLAIFFHAAVPGDTELAGLLYTIRGEVRRIVGVTPDYLIPVSREEVPKTGIGKIRRTELVQRFIRAEYKATIKRVDVLTRGPNTIPNWFFRPTWQRTERSPRRNEPSGEILLFVDDEGCSRRLTQELSARQQRCICVTKGTGFRQLGSNRFTVDPASSADYRQLLWQIASSGLQVHQVVHLWNHGSSHGATGGGNVLRPRSTEYGSPLSELILLVSALAGWESRPNRLCILVVTSSACFVQSGDTLVAERAALSGLIQTIPQEVPGISCRMLDIDHSPLAFEQIAAELATASTDTRVAYRGSHRMVPVLSQLDLQRDRNDDSPLVKGGFYLITGGLGGVGALLSKHLLERYDAKLLIIGRTSLSSEANTSPLTSHRRAELAKLQEQSRYVMYEAVDVCDEQALAAAVERASTHFQRRLDGILHLAGNTPARPLLEESAESIEETLRPKLRGALSIASLAELYPTARVIFISSSAGFFGGTMVGIYASACAFEQTFTAFISARRQGTTHCICFSAWQGIGASRHFHGGEAARARGFFAMSPEQGLLSFEAVLRAWTPVTVVGLDNTKPTVLQTLDHHGPVAAQKLVAFYAQSRNPSALPSTQHEGLEDRFGRPVPYLASRVPDLPRNSQGEIDRESLATMQTLGGPRVRIGPRTAVERQISAIFCQILKVSDVGIHDSFFELGGHSMQATQMTARLREVFHVELPLLRLFSAATVAKLAETITEYESIPGQVVRIAEILDTVDRMSPEEAAAALLLQEQEQEVL